ncbi:MAG: SMP-30/gluconolactonase/LRE family protein [Acidimicrobiia bacterium]
MTRALEPELMVEGFLFGEGPRWRDGRLWFSDMLAGVVYSTSEDGTLSVELELPRPSGLGFLPDGSLLIAAREYRTPEGELLRRPQLIRHAPSGDTRLLELTDGSNLNDMVVAENGDAYLDLYARVAPSGADDIMLVRPDGSSAIVATDIRFPNGMAITPDGRTLLVAETRGDCISSYSIAADGTLADRRVVATDVRTPDGLCLDAEGAVWTGSYSTGEFLRIDASGTVTDRVAVPDPQWAVAPMLGGHDRRTLYMITAETTMEGWPYGHSKGRIFQCRVGVEGVGLP